MTAEEWVIDDPQISSEEYLLRRVPNKPDWCQPDAISGRPIPMPTALQFDSDGMSVYQASILAELNVRESHLWNWGEFGAFKFKARCPRSVGGGVIHEDDTLDGRLGQAHSLVRGDKPSLSKSSKKAIREAILADFEWISLPPNAKESANGGNGTVA